MYTYRFVQPRADVWMTFSASLLIYECKLMTKDPTRIVL
jgi:hypothetical protein